MNKKQRLLFPTRKKRISRDAWKLISVEKCLRCETLNLDLYSGHRWATFEKGRRLRSLSVVRWWRLLPGADTSWSASTRRSSSSSGSASRRSSSRTSRRSASRSPGSLTAWSWRRCLKVGIKLDSGSKTLTYENLGNLSVAMSLLTQANLALLPQPSALHLSH